jgi:hypothetical protein
MNLFGKKATGVSAIEADVAQLEKRRGALGAKLASAQSALEAARAARREHLIESAEDDASATAKFEGAVATAERDVVALHDAIGELDARLADARKRLVGAKEAAEREAAAHEREKAAAAIEARAVNLEKAIDALADAFSAFASEIPVKSPATRYESGGARPANNFEVARAVLAQGLFQCLPDAFEVIGRQAIGAEFQIRMPVLFLRSDGHLHGGIPKEIAADLKFPLASGAADKIVVAPLRRVAEEIRAGRVPADASRPAPKPTPIEPPLPPLVPVYVMKILRYTNFRGDMDIVSPGDTHLPAPVYERALALGLAVTPEDPRAAEHRQTARRRPDVDMRFQAHLKPEEPVDLGVDVRAILDVERERLNEYREAAE